MSRIGDGFRRAAGAPLRALLPKNPWLRFLVIALPILIVLSLLEPVVNMAAKGAELIVQLVQPLLQTTAGRILLMVLVLGVLALVAGWALRGRIAEMRGRLALGRHLQAVASLLGEERRRAADQFEKVARTRAQPPAEFPHLVQDANLKLARLCLEDGRVNESLAWLARVVEKGLPRELRRSVVQLRAEALLRQGEVLPETLEQELRRSVERFSDDYRLHGLLRRVLLAAGRSAEAAAVQEHVARLAPPARAAVEKQQWLDDLVAAGDVALKGGDTDAARRLAKKARGIDRSAPAPGCLLGKIRLAEGDVRGAIREWGATRSPEGLDLVAQILRDHPGAMEPRELLECCPMRGTLLLVARELARRGEHEKAGRAARRAARLLGPSPTVAAMLAEVLQLIGHEEQATMLAEEAVLRLVAPGQDAG